MQIITLRRSPVFPAEPIFNIYVFVRAPRPSLGIRGYVNQYGVVTHQMKGTDRQKTEFLQSMIGADLTDCQRFDIAHGRNLVEFSARTSRDERGITYDFLPFDVSKGHHLDYFKTAFEHTGAPPQPICCITGVFVEDLRAGADPFDDWPVEVIQYDGPQWRPVETGWG